jgi:hypothetical protein
MNEETNKWNDPPGVNLDRSVETATSTGTSTARTWAETPQERDGGRTGGRRGPFARARNLLSWVFWGGLVLAAVVGGVSYGGVSGAIQLVLGFFVGIGIWVALVGWILWGIDKVSVYGKEGE